MGDAHREMIFVVYVDDRYLRIVCRPVGA